MVKRLNAMYIITLSTLKGGSGKSTLSINMARAIQLREMSVVIIDLDKQATSFMWSQIKPTNNIKVIQATIKTLKTELAKLSSYDVVILDTPPQIEDIAIETIRLSNLVLIPVCPSTPDYWAASSFSELVIERMNSTPELKAAFIMSKVKYNNGFANEVKSALQHINLPILDTAIMDRVSYARSLNNGETVFETNDERAIFDMRNLLLNIDEVVSQ